MNGYTEEGFDEWARKEIARFPSYVDIISMENELGIPHINEIEIVGHKEAWTYYHELKARLDQQHRKTA